MVRFHCEAEAEADAQRERDDWLDEALDQIFPASDPVAWRRSD
ncbi:MAG TPA: hypothetical protein VNA21_16575 [Steroidobacteraceae bacterium]|nr:hypothetical protein [Steroidobacteraceae bacterium]